jgi:predicted nucleotidyltransferase
MEEKFEHRVSKGSRYNQIYIPRGMEQVFEVGDIVEVRLVKKQNRIFYSENTKKLGEFKEEIARKIFLYLSFFKEIKQVFIFGSFLTEKTEYNDIDILLVCDKQIETKVHEYIINKIQLKFHVLSYSEEKLRELLEIDPMIRSMLFYFVSNKKIEIQKERQIDKKHIEFLLMMPEDLLRINAESRVYFDSLRRLLTIREFLDKKDEDPIWILSKLEKLLGNRLYQKIKNNQQINSNEIRLIRNVMKNQIKLIRRKI